MRARHLRIDWNLLLFIQVGLGRPGGAPWGTPGCSGKIPALHRVSEATDASRGWSRHVRENTWRSGSITDQEETRLSIKVNVQPASEVHSTLSTPRTKTERVPLGAGGATGKEGHVLLSGGHSYFLSESSGRGVCEPEITHRTRRFPRPHVHTSTRPLASLDAAISPSFSLGASFKRSLWIWG